MYFIATTTTTMAKGTNSPTPVSSSSIKTINKIEAAKAIAERNIKAKSVATVRPTVQQNLSQAATKLMNSNDVSFSIRVFHINTKIYLIFYIYFAEPVAFNSHNTKQ